MTTLYEQSIHALARGGLDTNKFPIAYVKAALDTCKGKFKLFGELPAYAGFYFKDDIAYDPEAAQKDSRLRISRVCQSSARPWPRWSPSRPTPSATAQSGAQELG